MSHMASVAQAPVSKAWIKYRQQRNPIVNMKVTKTYNEQQH